MSTATPDRFAVNAGELGQLVSELHAQRRAESLASHGQALPSREALKGIVAGLRAALFPAHFGPADLTEQGLDYFVGHTLGDALRELNEQVRRSLRSSAEPDGEGGAARAARVTRAFAARLPAVRALLESDARAAFEGDPAAETLDEPLVCYPGVSAIIHHRLAHEMHVLGATLLARVVSEVAHEVTGIDIHPGAQIGGSFFIDHGTGVVIGETSSIGQRVRLYQGVTLGGKSFSLHDRGAPSAGAERRPIVEDDVVIHAGATILGPITIGRGSSIGGNVWLTHSVPPGSRISQAKVRVESFDGGAGI